MNEEVKNKRLNRKSKKLIIVLFFTMAFFVVITYAWFIGLSVAKVNTFEVKITTTEGLSLSLNGLDFYDEINLGNTEDEILETVLNAYPNNPNSWLGVTQAKWNASGDSQEVLENKKTTDLLPVSTNGLIDQNGSVLTLFSKSSMTSSEGGYELTSDRYMNKLDASGTYLPDEQKGYISFNLFIKNNDNTRYINSYNMFNDEAVYLSTDSKVSLVQSSEYDGESTGGDGLENSLRIAFMQIGRVSSDSSQAVVTSITCETTDIVTGLCNAYSKRVDTEQPDGTYYQKDTDVYESNFNTFAIWEPNDKLHTEASKNHFTRICRNRLLSGAYSSMQCSFYENAYMNTYVVRNKIVNADNVDIYDGLNDYNVNTDIKATKPLQKMQYYTDSVKEDGDYRNQLFMLAPNSITLVKVYIYLEGQDIDNYDIDSVGNAFSIEFGFTKDKYEDTEGGNTHIAGDLNGDGIINSNDVNKLSRYTARIENPEDTFEFYDIYDINNNGAIGSDDLTILAKYVNGDVNTFPLKEYHETFPDVNFRKCLSENYAEGESLNCSNMNIKSVQGIETIISTLPSVDLSLNRISKFPKVTLAGSLNLSYNNLSSLSLNSVPSTLAANHNKLTSVHIDQGSGLGMLDLSNNLLDWDGISDLPTFMIVDLSYNRLTEYNRKLASIDIHLNGNQLTRLETDVLSSNNYLSHNNINVLLGSALSANYIDVSYNNLTSFSATANYANASHNNLSTAHIVAKSSGSTFFDLSHNNLHSLTIFGSESFEVDIRGNRYVGCISITENSPVPVTITSDGQTYCS